MDVSSISVEVAGYTVTGEVLAAAVAAVVVVLALVVLRRGSRRRHRAAEAQAANVARHEAAVDGFREAATAWQSRREELQVLLRSAQEGGSAEGPEGLKLQKGERVYFSTEATLEGHDVDDERGRLTITSRRIVLDGNAEHAWDLDAVAAFRHVGQDRTMIQPCEQCSWVCLSYADAPLTRMYLELATSTTGSSRSELLRNLAQGLNDHELRRPNVPVPSEPAEGLGRRARTAAESWYAARTAETEALRALVDSTVVMVPTQTRASRDRARVPVTL